ncbi:MAG TPA: hypothetical protein VGQ62_00745 [Chloroflexota bacterium]|nr:hypothetical protein [Chloroflexota bacterium]
MHASAEPDVPAATLTCTAEPLPTRAFEVNAVRLTCRVTGAAASDTSFTVSLPRSSDDPVGQPLCSAPLDDGAGSCIALLRDRSSIADDLSLLTATLEPSGTLVRPDGTSPLPNG